MESRYSLVVAVAKRAKQLKDGAPGMLASKSRNPIVIAMEEIAHGDVKIIIPTAAEIVAASRRHEIPATRPNARETADLLRVTDDFEADLVDVIDSEVLLPLDSVDEVDEKVETLEEESTELPEEVEETEEVDPDLLALDDDEAEDVVDEATGKEE